MFRGFAIASFFPIMLLFHSEILFCSQALSAAEDFPSLHYPLCFSLSVNSLLLLRFWQVARANAYSCLEAREQTQCAQISDNNHTTLCAVAKGRSKRALQPRRRADVTLKGHFENGTGPDLQFIIISESQQLRTPDVPETAPLPR